MSDDEIIKEQARLLTYILKYAGLNSVLPYGWEEDCERILAEATARTKEKP